LAMPFQLSRRGNEIPLSVDSRTLRLENFI
jgi:hypothetical protein